MFHHVRATGASHKVVLLIALVALNSPRSTAQEEKGAGAVISPEAKAKDVGLPVYPGSRPHKEKEDDSAGANLGLWGGGSGFKMAILKLETGATPEKVAAYYKKELAKYGTVLDCSKPRGISEDAGQQDSSKGLRCGDDKPENGGLLFKSGTKEKQHIVGIQAFGHGTFYQLIYLGAWSSEGKK
jgi:hypothetical protein